MVDPTQSTPNPIEILVAEDELVTRKLLMARLSEAGFNVHAPELPSGVAFSEEILSVARQNEIQVAICDLTLPDTDESPSVLTGLSLLKSIRELGKGTHIVVYSGSVDQESLKKLKKLGVAASHSKDDPNGLNALLQSVMELSVKPRRRRALL